MNKTAFVFPGQGSQSVGMGKDLFERYSGTTDVLSAADEFLGFNIRDLCLNGPEERLNQTRNTQLAMFVVNHIAGCMLKEKSVSPGLVLGHSLGEYNAIVTAGVLGFSDALRLVQIRADLMQKAASVSPGKMIAVLGLDSDIAEKVATGNGTYIANYNCPGQVVLSGEEAKIGLTARALEKAGAKRVVELNVSGAFHSPIMQPAAEEFSKHLDMVAFEDAEIPVISNFTGYVSMDKDEIKNALKQQMTGSVRWQTSVGTALSQGVNEFVEAGSGKVLSGLIKRITADNEKVMILSVNDY
jgi:[acyl-carrier-protein] S-malonyltransferase